MEETGDWKESDKENWVRCDVCKTWFHWRCAGEGELDVIDKWYAHTCATLVTAVSVSLVHCLQVL